MTRRIPILASRDATYHYRTESAKILSLPEEPTLTAAQREVLRGLDSAVRENLSLLAPIDKAWQPTDYLPDLTAPDWADRLSAFRDPVVQLPDDVLVVL